MKKFLFIFMILLFVVSFSRVEIVDTKNDSGVLTGGRTLEYKDEKGEFFIYYDKTEPIEIKIKTKNTPSKIDDKIGISIDYGYNLNIKFYIDKDAKSISIYPTGSDAEKFKSVLEQIENVKRKELIYDYTNSKNQTVTRIIPLKEIREGIEKLKNKANEPVSAITKKTRGKGEDKQVWIEGTGWVYENLIEKESYKPTQSEINEIKRNYNIPEEAAVKYLIDKHKK